MVYVSIGHSNDVTAMCLLFSVASEGKNGLGKIGTFWEQS